MTLSPELRAEEPCEFLDWDSQFWGFPIGRIRGGALHAESLAAIHRWCQERAIACLYFLATFDDPITIRTAEDEGFRLADTRLTLRRTAVPRSRAVEERSQMDGSIRPCVPSDIEALQEIAGKSHHDTRFYFDLHFPRDKSQLLYQRWIAESCNGYADRVFVAAVEDAPAGYITCHLPTGGEVDGRIGLVGVAQYARGRGVGRQLVGHALDWFALQGVPMVSVVTQGRNISAQALYQRCGFVSQAHQLWYHKWFRLPE